MTQLIEQPTRMGEIPSIHQHPDEILAGLALLGASEADPDDSRLLVGLARQDLASAARIEHTLALMILAETDQPTEVPTAVVCPNIIGAETIYGLVRERKEAGAVVMPHPDDPAKHLIHRL